MRVIIEFQASFIIINYLNLFFRTQLKKASCVASELPFDIKKKNYFILSLKITHMKKLSATLFAVIAIVQFSFAQAGALDVSFQPKGSINGFINKMLVQPDGKILVE
jgi:hypothetical protein